MYTVQTHEVSGTCTGVTSGSACCQTSNETDEHQVADEGHQKYRQRLAQPPNVEDDEPTRKQDVYLLIVVYETALPPKTRSLDDDKEESADKSEAQYCPHVHQLGPDDHQHDNRADLGGNNLPLPL